LKIIQLGQDSQVGQEFFFSSPLRQYSPANSLAFNNLAKVSMDHVC
jgi:hypothetical protein